MTRPLTIGVDARELLGEATGVGRYLGELLRRWVRRPDAPRRRFVLYAPGAIGMELLQGTAPARVIGTGTGTWWEQTALRRAVRSDPPDVFFSPAYTAPLALGIPLAVTIHDVSFAAHPEWFRPREGMRRRWLTARTASAASVVFTDSEFSRREIQSHLKVPAAKIQVISPGMSERTRGSAVQHSEEHTPRAPMILYVGSIFNRRRLPDLIAAFARATNDLPSARLVVVGPDRTWPKQDLAGVAAAHGVAARVDFRAYVTDGELEDLYARAAGFAFLSEYEGFGLTPLEAMAAGVPAVVLDTPVAREVYADAAMYVSPGDIHGTAAALRRFLVDPHAARDILAPAPAVLARYSWDVAADRTLEHLERVAVR